MDRLVERCDERVRRAVLNDCLSCPTIPTSHRCRSCRHPSGRWTRRWTRRWSRPCSASRCRTASRYWCRRCFRQCCPCLTSRNATSHRCRRSALLRRPCLHSDRRRHLAGLRYRSRRPASRATTPTPTTPTIPTSSMSPMTIRVIPTSPAFLRRDHQGYRCSSHDSDSGPPWHYPPAYFDCDLHV